MLATLLLAALPWYGPLSPVDGGRMVVAASCRRGQPLTWSPALRRQAHGMEPGERVWVITRTGAVSTRLGKPTCYAGECRGDYASLELPKISGDPIAVVPHRFLEPNDEVRPLEPALAAKFRDTSSALEPRVLLVRNKAQFILWRESEGIGGPARITLVLSRIEADGSLTFGPRYSAGGQPCD